MQNQAEAVDTLNKLVKANNDRIAGYKQAVTDSKDVPQSIVQMLEARIPESDKNNDELAGKIIQLGGQLTEDADDREPGTWLNIRSAFSGKDTKSILSACERYEDAAQDAYESALSDHLGPDLKQMVMSQKSKLKMAHDMIKKQRDTTVDK